MATKGENTRAKILEKAAVLFAEKGYNAVTMKDVCEATGLSRGGLYRNFASTADMMVQLMRQEQERADIAERENFNITDSAVSHLDGFLQQHKSYMLSPMGRLELAINQFGMSDERGIEENRLRLDRAVTRTTRLISFGQEQGVFVDGDAQKLAALILFAIGGLRTNAALLELGEQYVSDQLNMIRALILK